MSRYLKRVLGAIVVMWEALIGPPRVAPANDQGAGEFAAPSASGRAVPALMDADA